MAQPINTQLYRVTAQLSPEDGYVLPVPEKAAQPWNMETLILRWERAYDQAPINSKKSSDTKELIHDKIKLQEN